MTDTAQPKVPTAQMSSEAAEGASKQSTLEQVNEIEPSEQIRNVESKTMENVQRELGTSMFGILSEQPQPFSKNVAKDSLPQILGEHSFPQLTISEKDSGQDVCTPPENRPGCEASDELESGNVFGQQQPGSKYVVNEPAQDVAAAGSSPVNKHSGSFSGNVTNNSLTEELDLPLEDMSPNCQAGKTSCPKVTIELKHECGAGDQCTEPSEQKHHIDSNPLQNEAGETNSMVSSFVVNEQYESKNENRSSICDGKLAAPSEVVIRNCQTDKGSCSQQNTLEQTKEYDCGCVLGEIPKREDQLGSGIVQNVAVESSNGASDFVASEHLEPPLGDVSRSPISKQVEQPSEDVIKWSSLEQLEISSQSLRKNSSQLGRRDKRTSKSRKNKYMLRSLVGNDRVLRSRTQEKPQSLESSNNLGNAGNGVERKRKERKKRRQKRVVADEFSRIRKRLRYFLHRIKYEQNLIDAYSSEGWKGNSLEKLKPEKELQRATSEIFRRKLKIRDLFQQLDSLCAEGRFPKSLFDSEGQIDSEDIFCAKCGSKELSADNDIILCDGACDRGFHQFCLEPPLLSEDIPPDDEGWLCPGCDCKVDCFDLLNDSHGTNLSVSDSWEKVFPEAAAAAREGKNQEHNPDIASDDSDDDDYDPDGLETDDKVEGDESSSDESEYASACDELEAPRNHEQSLGHSSDDSEDNDYDPSALDIDKQESSSSDFTSDSEDLAATLDDNSEKDEVHMSSLDAKPLGKSDKQGFRRDGKKSSLEGELLDILKSGPGKDGSPPVSGRRHVERLDYKKLHDETYGNVPTDSSDDEDWNGTAATRKRKKTGQVASELPNGNASTNKNEATMEAINHNLENNEHISRRRRRQKSVVKDTNDSPSKLLEGSPKSSSTGRRVKSSSYRRLGEAVTQRLYKFFKENQYPDRATKQSLAEELGLTSQQVGKWFENMRWSSRHSSCKEAGISESASKTPQKNEKLLESEQQTNIRNSTCNGTQNEEPSRIIDALPVNCSRDVSDGKAKVFTKESSGQNSAAPTTARKRGRPRIERPKMPALEDGSETGGGRKRGRRKSAP